MLSEVEKLVNVPPEMSISVAVKLIIFSVEVNVRVIYASVLPSPFSMVLLPLDALMLIFGFVPSIKIAVFDPSEPFVPGLGNFNVVPLPNSLFIDPPFKVREFEFT